MRNPHQSCSSKGVQLGVKSLIRVKIALELRVRKQSGRVTAVLALAVCVLWAKLLPAQSDENYQSSISKDYHYAFGDNTPFLPSQALTSSGRFIEPSRFPSAAHCGRCHEDTHREWRQSAHANSFRAPFYTKSVELLIKEKGIESTRHCEGCHNPIALFSGALTPGSKLDRSFDEDGVTCSVCHSIQRIQHVGGTGSYVMGVPSDIVAADGMPIPGEASYDEILAHPDRHSRAVMKDFYRTPEFCAVCHKASIPRMLNGYKWLRAFSVYDEWQQSSWSQETPLPFYKKDTVSTCQTCHMAAVDSSQDYGAKSGKIRSHRFLGANTAIPAFYGYREQLDKVREFLKDAVAVDFFGIEKESPNRKSTPDVVLGEQQFNLAPGETITVDLVIQNRKIGHSLVPEQRDFYECWVEFVATDANGKILYRSGYLEPNGYLEEHAHSYTNRLISSSGEFLNLHQVWNTKAKGYDNTILPGRSDLVRYRFHIPPASHGPLAITAKVTYRRFRRSYTDFVFQSSRDFPITEIASQTVMLNLGPNQRKPRTDQKTELQRWNNYGIALLGQFQYWQAEKVFQKVVQIDPSYADGYINVALAQYSELIENKKEGPDGVGNMSFVNAAYEKYLPALNALGRALQLSPRNPRALYYQGVIYRLQNRLSAAAENQKLLVSAFPRFRQVRQELGYVNYLQKNYSEARSQFQALQSINPDDLTAHYYLSLIYRQLGIKEKADEEGAKYAEQRDDPTVGAIAQEFWRGYPAVGDEVIPYHVHGVSITKQHPSTIGGTLP